MDLYPQQEPTQPAQYMNPYPQQEPTQPAQSYYDTYGNLYSVSPPPPPPPPAPRHHWRIVIASTLLLLLVIGGAAIAYQIGRMQANVPPSATVTSIIAPSTTAALPTLQPTPTYVKHVTAVYTGTGFDQNTGRVIGQRSNFHISDTVWIVYTVTNPDPGAQVVLKLYNNGVYEASSNPVILDAVTNTYANSVTVQNTGVHEVEIDYNGIAEASVIFNVT